MLLVLAEVGRWDQDSVRKYGIDSSFIYRLTAYFLVLVLSPLSEALVIKKFSSLTFIFENV